MPKDYYAILGVSKSANDDEIKKSFRRLAHEHHPDKGGDASKFKDINEAYQILGDKQKRATYDQYGSAAFENGGAGQGGFGGGFGGFPGGGFDFNFQGQDFGDLNDVLGEMFGFGGGRGGRREKRGQNIEVDVELSFRDSVFGADKTLKLYRQLACEHCKGEGAEPGTKVNECKTCGGKGQVSQATRTMFGTMQTLAECKDCRGRGKKPEKECTVCAGHGVHRREQNLSIRIPAGVDNGAMLQVAGEGEAPAGGGRSGDLFVRIHVEKHPTFERDGNDIVSEMAIPFSVLAIGGTIHVPTIDGDESVRIAEGTQDGTLVTIRGKGIPYSRSGTRGNHVVRLIADIPRKLSKEQKELLEQLRNTGL
jgi:molecular chaperone DnaJ